jgi:anti-anti-sigma factor
MKYNITKGDKYIIFKIEEDRLDAVVSPDVKSHMIVFKSEEVRNIIIDLADVQYADSSGLSAILTANRVCKEQNGILILTNVSEQVRKLLEITQLHRVIEILPTDEEAIDRVYMHEVEKDLGGDE